MLQTHEVRSLQEKCGIVATYSSEFSNNLTTTLLATGGIQHRGQHSAGIAMYCEHGITRFNAIGLVKDIFTSEIIQTYDQPNIWSVLHCRYGTNGSYSDTNIQPTYGVREDSTRIVVAHNGEFIMTPALEQIAKTITEKDVSDTYLFTQLLLSLSATDSDSLVKNALQQVKGSFSIIIAVGHKLYVSRDPDGIRPLVIGKIHEQWMIASETQALDKAGAVMIREVRRGEIIRFDASGMTSIQDGESGVKHFCDFEWCYFARPESLFPTFNQTQPEKDERMSVYEFRDRCGVILAQEKPIKKASFVVGVPDSGLSLANGYAFELGLRIRQVILRDHFNSNGSQRLFMRDDDKKAIERKVLGKLSLVPDSKIWKDAIVVLCDDSLVRGNVSKKLTQAILQLGAKEVHWMIGYPQVTHTCHLGVSIRTREELIAFRLGSDSKKIALDIGATSVNYISNRGFIKARILSGKLVIPKDENDIFLVNGGCGGCVMGRYPV
ncbi:MAG: hypothetical protein WCO06_06795 [Candidatus Roizmanbacteria bacterium]